MRSPYVVIMFVLTAWSPVEAMAKDWSEDSLQTPGGYCGINCVYAAAKALKTEVQFKDLVHSDYLSGAIGSTANDLCRAIDDVGLEADFRRSISIDSLKSMNSPAILHVRSVGQTHRFSHWVLFLGFENGEIQVYDPPYDHGQLDVRELLAIWDGAGIVVSEKDAPLQSRLWKLMPISAFTILCISVNVLVLRVWAERLHGKAVLASMALSVLIGQFASANLWSSSARQVVHSIYDPPNAPKEITYEALQEKSEEQRVYIDARPATAFNDFHLPGAINLPIDAGLVRLVNLAGRLQGEDGQVVVYCQSARCVWADRIANQLAAKGVGNVRVYRGGVEEWKARQGE